MLLFLNNNAPESNITRSDFPTHEPGQEGNFLPTVMFNTSEPTLIWGNYDSIPSNAGDTLWGNYDSSPSNAGDTLWGNYDSTPSNAGDTLCFPTLGAGLATHSKGG